MHDYNFSSTGSWKVNLRIGIHLGDVAHRVGDVFGDAVNIASRIEPLAEPEEICVAQQVFDQVQNKLDYPLVRLGNALLKNVKAPLTTYRVVLPWERRVKNEQQEITVRAPKDTLNLYAAVFGKDGLQNPKPLPFWRADDRRMIQHRPGKIECQCYAKLIAARLQILSGFLGTN